MTKRAHLVTNALTDVLALAEVIEVFLLIRSHMFPLRMQNFKFLELI